MEKIPAACAMEWSIELEKGLRSKKPGYHIEVIEQIGQKLLQWGSEPSVTKEISDMYSMIPGEERMFANTILLRLANAFCYGDNHTRGHILKVFTIISKDLRKKGKRYNGILAKQRVPNYIELLKRVKIVFDTEGTEAKALALGLFGCWADLAKDSAQIRRMILLSLQSSHDLEVKASLFAAGCFCRLSEDFACIVLEILIDMISSLRTSLDMKLKAVHTFSSMRCSSSIASRAYKAGKKLLLTLQQEDLKVEMLLSLSKLAFNSSLLIPEQVDLLLSTVRHESASLVRARALKCLYFLFSGGACFLYSGGKVLTALINITDDSELPLKFHCEALKILQIICRSVTDMPHRDMSDFIKLVQMAENAAQSSVKAKRCLAFGLLVDIFCSMKKAMKEHWCSAREKWHAAFFQLQMSLDDNCDRDGPTSLVCHVVFLIIDYMNSLAQMTVVSRVAQPEVKQEIKSLLNLILHLVQEYPTSAYVALDKMRCLIQTLGSMNGRSTMEAAGTYEEVSQIIVGAGKDTLDLRPCTSNNKLEISIAAELIVCICRFTIACLSILDESGAVSSEMYQKVKILVECIQQSGSHSCSIYETFCLNMLSYAIFKCYEETHNSSQDLDKSKVGAELGYFHNVYWVAQEWRALKFIKQMLERQRYWEAYRVGKYCCCEGAWFAATFTFRKLVDKVQSHLCRCWIRSLLLFAGGESEIKLLLFPKVGINMINGIQTDKDCGQHLSCVEREMSLYDGGDVSLHGCEGKIAKIYSRICSSEEILANSGASAGVYYFQRWFLTLRAKVLEIMVDMLGLLGPHTSSEETYEDSEGHAKIHPVGSQTMHALVSRLSKISCCLTNLAKEYDLLAISFLDIDSESFRNISRLALSCSVLAFCTAFSLYFLKSPAYKNHVHHCLGNMEEVSHTMVIKDLVERLWDIDQDLTTKLNQFMISSGEAMNYLHCETQMNGSCLIDRSTLFVYKSFIGSVLSIQEDFAGKKDEKGVRTVFTQGLQLLASIIKRWMEISCWTPKYFFRVRPCIGAELFIFNVDSKSTNGLFISPGFQLSLNLCIQLKNASRDLYVQVDKIYCILAVMPSDLANTGEVRERQAQWGFQARKTNEIVELNEILHHYIKTDSYKVSRKDDDNVNGHDWVTTCVCFEPNEKGQSFSTCLVDVSSLPEGSYLIKWHSCCIDKKGLYSSLLPLNPGLVLTIKKP